MRCIMSYIDKEVSTHPYNSSKSYENVMSDCFSRRDSISQSALETQSNAYATINKLPMAGSSRRSLFNGSLDITDHNESRDYATLEKSYRCGSIIVNFN